MLRNTLQMKLTRIMISAICAIAMSMTFAQDVSADQEMKQRVAEIAGRYKESKDASKDRIALDDFLKIADKFSDAIEVNSWIGFLMLRTEEPAKAIIYLEKALEKNRELNKSSQKPIDLEVLNNLGNAYMKTRNSAKALAVFEELSVLDSTKFQPFYNKGNYYLEARQYEKAAQAFKEAANRQPDRPQILNNLGVAYEGLGKLDQAAAEFVKASDLDPTDYTYAQNAGLVLHRSRKYASAASYLERALKNGSKEKNTVITLGDCYSNLKKNDALAKLYVDYSSVLGDDPNYYYNLGVMRKNSGDPAGAESAFRKAYQLRDTDTSTLANLGVLLFNRGEYEESRLIFEKLMGLEPTAKNKRNFAAAASRSGDVKAALPIWNEILKTNANDHEVRLLVADAMFEMGDVQGALAQYKRVVAVKKDSALALDGIGRCHLFNANYVAAEASLRSAIAADSKCVQAYNNLAVVLEKMNKRKEAITLLEKAASIDSENADVQRNLKRMKSAG